MTVSSETSKVSYAGNDSTTEFSTGFAFIADADVLVTLVSDATGAETAQTITTHYTLTGAGTGVAGTLTTLTAPPFGYTLVISRDMEFTQETDYVENDPFPAETHETALDKLTMICQQLAELASRTIRFPLSTTGNNVTLPIPDAGKALAWNTAEDGLINTNIDIASVADSAEAAEAAALAASATLQGWVDQVRTTEIFDGGEASYTLSYEPASIEAVEVIVDGVYQTPTVDFTLSGAVVTPVTAFPAGTGTVLIRYGYGVFIDYADSTTGVEFGGTSLADATFSDATPLVVRSVYDSTVPLGWNTGFGLAGVEFDIAFNDYFAANPTGHLALILRCDTDVIETYTRGQGMIFGNVSGAQEGASNYPTTQIETFFSGLGAPAGQRYLIPGSEGRTDTPLLDGEQYKVICTAMQAHDGNSYIRYQLYRYNNTYSAWDLERDTGDVRDDNTYADLTNSGIAIGHAFNDDLVPWTVEITNMRSFWGPAREPTTHVNREAAEGGGSTFDGNLSANLSLLGNERRIKIVSDDVVNFEKNAAFQDQTTNSGTTVFVIPNGTSNISSYTAFSDSAFANGHYLSMATTASAVKFDSGKLGTGTTRAMEFRVDDTVKLKINTDDSISIPGTDRTLRANTSSATLSERFSFQDLSASTPTVFTIRPGSGDDNATIVCTNDSDMDAASAQLIMGMNSSDAVIQTFATGGGSYPDLIVKTGLTTAFTIKTTGVTEFSQNILLPGASAQLGSSASWASPTGTAYRHTFNSDSYPSANLTSHADYIVGIMRYLNAMVTDLKARRVI
jgi:hypothetical protein